MDTTIICLGNRLLPEDSAGPAVFDSLHERNLPDDIEIFEGGTAGLNLLPLLERENRVVFVDSVSGYTSEGNIVLLDLETITHAVSSPQFGHDTGLPYVLSILPEVSDGKIPSEIVLIGLEGECSEKVIHEAADLCITVALNGS